MSVTETMAETTAKMEKAVACLALELPAEVWEDVRDIWHAARDAAKALDESRMWAIDRNLTDAGEREAFLKMALGDLIDALHDELCYEVGQSPHVLDHVESCCRLLGSNYSGYVGSWL